MNGVVWGLGCSIYWFVRILARLLSTLTAGQISSQRAIWLPDRTVLPLSSCFLSSLSLYHSSRGVRKCNYSVIMAVTTLLQRNLYGWPAENDDLWVLRMRQTHLGNTTCRTPPKVQDSVPPTKGANECWVERWSFVLSENSAFAYNYVVINIYFFQFKFWHDHNCHWHHLPSLKGHVTTVMWPLWVYNCLDNFLWSEPNNWWRC